MHLLTTLLINAISRFSPRSPWPVTGWPTPAPQKAWAKAIYDKINDPEARQEREEFNNRVRTRQVTNTAMRSAVWGTLKAGKAKASYGKRPQRRAILAAMRAQGVGKISRTTPGA